MDEARIHFYDGQRIRREDLEFLRDVLLGADRSLRHCLGRRGIAWGFQVSLGQPDQLTVGPGFGWDVLARPLQLSQAASIPFAPAPDGVRWLVATYAPVVVDELQGQPVRVRHGIEITLRDSLPPEGDPATPFAELRVTEQGIDVVQSGSWYLPALDGAHLGRFALDGAGRWRYDGDPPARSFAPHLDTGWVEVPAGTDTTIEHGLGSSELAVELIREPQAGVASNRGIGTDFWYELHGESVLRLFNAGSQALRLRARMWRLADPASAALAPVADAGDDHAVEAGSSFALDGGDSRAFEGRSVVRYIWTQLG